VSSSILPLQLFFIVVRLEVRLPLPLYDWFATQRIKQLFLAVSHHLRLTQICLSSLWWRIVGTGSSALLVINPVSVVVRVSDVTIIQ